MSSRAKISTVFLAILLSTSCNQEENKSEMKIIFLHHSTGTCIWNGNKATFFQKLFWKLGSNSLAAKFDKKPLLPRLFDKHNKKYGKDYLIKQIEFPKTAPYGWNNFPYDYYNIWVKHAGDNAYMEEPTLEMLARDYQVIIFKHCFPVSSIQEDLDSANINSDIKTLSNYKLQYNALRDKLYEFPELKFILFTGAVQVESQLTEDESFRTREFFRWVKEEWDQPNDNIYLWDLYELETEGGLYLKEEYAASTTDSHPNRDFSNKLVKLLFNRIIDVIENNGEGTRLTGETD